MLSVVTINDFRYACKERYYWVGVMSGSPYIDADVDFYKLTDKTAHIRRQYKATLLNHTTCSADGACALPPMTEEQIKIICDAIPRNWCGISARDVARWVGKVGGLE